MCGREVEFMPRDSKIKLQQSIILQYMSTPVATSEGSPRMMIISYLSNFIITITASLILPVLLNMTANEAS